VVPSASTRARSVANRAHVDGAASAAGTPVGGNTGRYMLAHGLPSATHARNGMARSLGSSVTIDAFVVM
jgi:hypothetical protein